MIELNRFAALVFAAACITLSRPNEIQFRGPRAQSLARI
jgi:hypothetical protein